jgi:hypoxanthine phosphoribosyltransferase
MRSQRWEIFLNHWDQWKDLKVWISEGIHCARYLNIEIIWSFFPKIYVKLQ